MTRHRRSASQKYHDRVAGRYQQTYNDVYWQWHDELTWDHLKKYLPSDMSSPVVDLGCGAGKWGQRLLKSGYHVTFVDLSSKMLDQAKKHVVDVAATGKANFLQADLMDLSPLPEQHFALAAAMGEPIGSAQKPARALKEIARIIAPGGLLVASFDNRIAGIDYYLERGDVDELQTFLRTGQTNWLTREQSERFTIHMFEPDQLRKMLATAGFEVVDMIGKTVLPMRHHRDRLAEPKQRRRWAQIEKRLARDPANFGRCAHLQIAARKRNSS